MYSHDKYYRCLQSVLKILRKMNLYNVKGIKGALYRFFSKIANFRYKPLSKEKMKELKNGTNHLIISLTTYGSRTNRVHMTLDSLFLQTVKPEKVILWLSEDEYTGKLDELSKEIVERVENIKWFEVRFCEDLKPHKKYFETMRAYPDATVVTVDDDVFYPSDWLEELVNLSDNNPGCICCTTAHYMTTDSLGNIKSYSDWIHSTDEIGPSLFLCPIGVGGVLYPPHCLYEDVFDKDFIVENCLKADDLWLKIMSLLKNTMVVRGSRYSYTFLSVQGSEKDGLSLVNVLQNKNDEQLNCIMRKYGDSVKEMLT